MQNKKAGTYIRPDRQKIFILIRRQTLARTKAKDFFVKTRKAIAVRLCALQMSLTQYLAKKDQLLAREIVGGLIPQGSTARLT
jgi:hypothetical protein